MNNSRPSNDRREAATEAAVIAGLIAGALALLSTAGRMEHKPQPLPTSHPSYIHLHHKEARQ